MYRRMESRDLKIEAVERKTEAICHCSCKTAQPKEGPSRPEANLTGSKLSLESEISG